MKRAIFKNLAEAGSGQKWTDVSWEAVRDVVSSLQERIALAASRGDKRQVRSLQRLLTNSMAAKLLAVRIAAQDNSGKHTAGIDGSSSWQSSQKMSTAYAMNAKTWEPKSVRLVEIPKAGSKKLRPLGIPTMYDRCMASLMNLALLPVQDETSDKFSYGFRPNKSCQAAAHQVRNCLRKSAKGTYPTNWVLDCDIKGFFDNISHEWMIDNIPMDSSILTKMLKAGVALPDGETKVSDSGTPQGGPISPTIANMVLDGMERYVVEQLYGQTDKWGKTYSTKNKESKFHGLHFIRYADDFVVTGRSERQLQRVKETVSQFLSERGLELSEEKTKVVHISEGFDFLGWTFKRTADGRLIKTISQKAERNHRKELFEFISNGIRGNKPLDILFKEVSTKIAGFCRYHAGCEYRHKVFSRCGHLTFQKVWREIKRKSPRVGHRRLVDIHTKPYDGDKWVFHNNGSYLITHGMKQNASLKIEDRQPQVDRKSFREEDKAYFQNFKLISNKGKMYGLWRKLFVKQQGICTTCGGELDIDSGEEIQMNHIIPSAKGGKTTVANCELLHRVCHEQSESHDGLQANVRFMKKDASQSVSAEKVSE